MKFKLKDVVPSPHRDLTLFPLKEDVLEKLMRSIKTIGFTTSLLGRVRSDGKLEQAFGHHRVEALRRLYGDDYQAEFEVRGLSHGAMLLAKVADNDPAYSHSMPEIIENVRATVLGFADGTFPAPEIDKHTSPTYLRYAPSFIAGLKSPPAGVPYTALYVAALLDRVLSDGHGGDRADSAVKAALEVLELDERGLSTINQSLGLKKGEQEIGDLRTLVAADYLLRFSKDVRKRHSAGLLVAQKNAEIESAAVREAQRNLDAIRKEKAEKRAAEDADRKRLLDLAEEDNRKESERQVREVWEKRKREEEAKKANAPRRRELEKKLKAAKAAEEKAARAARKSAPIIVVPKRPQPYLPHLTETITYFERDLPKCATQVLKDKTVLTKEQKQTLSKVTRAAIERLEGFADSFKT